LTSIHFIDWSIAMHFEAIHDGFTKGMRHVF
jgi:hypothetical protein